MSDLTDTEKFKIMSLGFIGLLENDAHSSQCMQCQKFVLTGKGSICDWLAESMIKVNAAMELLTIADRKSLSIQLTEHTKRMDPYEF